MLKFKTKYFSDMKEIVRLLLKENVEKTLAKEENVKKILFTFISILEINMGLINGYSVIFMFSKIPLSVS